MGTTGGFPQKEWGPYTLQYSKNVQKPQSARHLSLHEHLNELKECHLGGPGAVARPAGARYGARFGAFVAACGSSQARASLLLH